MAVNQRRAKNGEEGDSNCDLSGDMKIFIQLFINESSALRMKIRTHKWMHWIMCGMEYSFLVRICTKQDLNHWEHRGGPVFEHCCCFTS